MNDFPEYIVAENNINVIDSYLLTKKEINCFLDYIIELYPDSNVISNRSKKSLQREWYVHNLLYAIHISRSRTKDVDLDYPQKRYIRFAYSVFGAMSSIFLK